jgi:hypothetical protein
LRIWVPKPKFDVVLIVVKIHVRFVVCPCSS